MFRGIIAAPMLRRLLPLALLVSGCSGPTKGPPPPALPTLSSATLYYGPTAARIGWEGLPGTLRITGRNLADPTAPGASLRLTATRIRDLEGNVTAAPEVTGEVVLQGPPEALSAALEAPAALLSAGAWRVTLSDRRGLVGEREEAFLLLPRPVLTGVDRPTRCEERRGRRVRASVQGLPFGSQLFPALTGPAGEIPLLVEWYGGCASVGYRSLTSALCSSVQLVIPDEATAASGQLTLRFGGAGVALPPEGLSTPLAWETAGFSAAFDVGGTLAVFDAPGERVVWTGGNPALVRDGLAPPAWVGDQALPVRGEGCASTIDPAVQSCARLVATVPQGFPPGDHQLVVTTDTGCTVLTAMQVVDRPVLTGADPAYVCRRTAPAVRLLGTGLAGARALLSEGGTGPWIPIEVTGLSAAPDGIHLLRAEHASATPVVSSAPVPLAIYPGRLFIGERTLPEVVWAGARRPVRFFPSFSTGQLTARLVPAAGGAPVPVEVSSTAEGWSFFSPGLAGGGAFHLEVSDEAPCGTASTTYLFEALADPVRLAYDFEASTSEVFLARDGGQDQPGIGALVPEPAAGNPGAAVVGRRAVDGADWRFTWWYQGTGHREDLGLLRFDLRASGSGLPSAAPGLVVHASPGASSVAYTLHRALAPPAAEGWTSYEVRFDDPAGWTFTDLLATRPATVADLKLASATFGVLGSWWSGPGEAALDNVLLELAR